MRLTLAALAFAACPIAAQNDGSWVQPSPGAIAGYFVTNAPDLLARFPETALGRLWSECSIPTVVEGALARAGEMRAPLHELNELALRLGLLTGDEVFFNAAQQLDWRDFRSATLSAHIDSTGGFPRPSLLCVLEPHVHAEGRLAREFQLLGEKLRQASDLEPGGTQKVGSFPARVFQLRDTGEPLGMWTDRNPRWLLHLPGQFTIGQGEPDKIAHFGARPPEEPSEFGIFANMGNYLRMFAGMGAGLPSAAMGIDNVGDARCRWRFVGELLQGEMIAEFEGEPEGLVAAFLNPAIALPRQPLPDGVLLQLRLGVDWQRAWDSIEACEASVGESIAIDADLRRQIRAVFQGGIGIGVGAPAPGGLVPRVYLALGIAERKALDALLARLPELGFGTETRKQGAGEYTLLRMDGMPAGIQPCYAFHGGVLHACESVATMRGLLRALEGDGDAMDIGPAPVPEGPGTVQANFDLRYDCAAIHNAVDGTWWPLLRTTTMMMGQEEAPRRPLVDADALPEARDLVEHLNKGRGVLRRDGNTFVYAAASNTGGPLLFSGAWIGLLALANDLAGSTTDRMHHLQGRIGQHRLRKVADAIDRFRSSNGHPPESLAVLAASGLLGTDDQALLIPGDDQPERIEFTTAGGTARVLLSSFHYDPKGIEHKPYQWSDEKVRITVWERRARGELRLVLPVDGAVDEWYGQERNGELPPGKPKARE